MSLLSSRSAIDLQFTGLSYSVSDRRIKGYKKILNEVSGQFLSGQLSAILGPSGAGKTTLLNILSGFRRSKVSGEILVNGMPRCLKSFRKQSCYIMQDDHLLQFLTIKESMQAAAILKLGKNVTKEKRSNLIREILATLNLEESKNTRVSNLSGGEKKRLSIAFELINNPPVMFFDEPTSGLDSQNSYHCISLLRKLAEGGRTIICTIHQPSARIFETFDYLYALAEGHCIYRGTVPGLIPFMSSASLECPSYHNPADFLIEVASGEYGNYIIQLEQSIGDYKQNKAEAVQTSNRRMEYELGSVTKMEGESGREKVNNYVCFSNNETKVEFEKECEKKFLGKNEDSVQYPVSLWLQFCVLLMRTFRSVLRDPMLTLIQFASHVGVGIFIGILYYNIGNEASSMQSNVGCLILCLLFLMFTSMMTTILTFSLEMKVFVREHLNNWYSLKAYYLAKTIVDIPFQVLFTILFISIVYFMTNQPYDVMRYFYTTSISILTSLTSQSMGLAIGAALDAQEAVYFSTALLIPIVLFSGVFTTFSTIPFYIRWLTHISYVRYGYEGFLLAMYGNGRGKLECSEAFCMFKYSEKIMQHFEIEERTIWIHISVLALNLFIFRFLGYFSFRWKLRRGR